MKTKNGFLVIAFSLFLFPAFAGELNLRNLKFEPRSITDSFRPTAAERFPKMNTNNKISCVHENDLRHYIHSGYENMVTLRKIIAFYKTKPDISKNKKHLKTLTDIDKVAACIQKKLPYLEVDCNSPSTVKVCNKHRDVNAYTTPALYYQKIFICPNLWLRNNLVYQAAVIIHEVSHLCGTDDIKYIDGPGNKPKPYATYFNPLYALGKTSLPGIKIGSASHLNGDTYEYWMKKGFCLPGYDCE